MQICVLDYHLKNVFPDVRSEYGVGFIDVFQVLCEMNGTKWEIRGPCALPVWFEDNILNNVGYQMDGAHFHQLDRITSV